MKLISTEFGQSFLQYVIDELRPLTGGLYFPGLIGAVAERYKFANVPTVGDALQQGAKFAEGCLLVGGEIIAIRQIGIYNDGIIVVAWNTDESAMRSDGHHQRAADSSAGVAERGRAGVVCLQELKAPDERFPESAIGAAGYGAIWHGQKSWNGVAILARGSRPVETRRGLRGDPDDTHSRYIEAAVDGTIVGCLYLPNGNPAPGPKFDYKLRWFDRLADHARNLLACCGPVVLAGDYNVMPTELDVYAPERWVEDALFRPEVREAYRRLVAQGWTDPLRARHPRERISSASARPRDKARRNCRAAR